MATFHARRSINPAPRPDSIAEGWETLESDELEQLSVLESYEASVRHSSLMSVKFTCTWNLSLPDISSTTYHSQEHQSRVLEKCASPVPHA
jgi:hypothetical protein